jgi:hypothetical protein
MASEPVCQFGFREVTPSQSENKANHFGLLRFDSESVKAEEDVHGLERHALVPIHEGVISRKAETVRCGEIEEIGFRRIVEPVPGSIQCRVEETLIS